jgi:hypothetical protein
MSDNKIPNELIQLCKENCKKDDISITIKNTKPLILCPFGFYSNVNMYLIPHPDYPDNLDMY